LLSKFVVLYTITVVLFDRKTNMTNATKFSNWLLAFWLFWFNLAVTQAAEQVTPAFSPENAQWEVFTNRSLITTVLLSENSKILWVGTNGGLEKRDAQRGEIQQIFVNANGLPGNYIQALLLDNQGNLWVGTEKGLARYNTQQQWEMFNAKNSELPNEYLVYALLNDTQGNLWIGTSIGLVRYNQAEWQIINTENSDLPSNKVTALLNDNQGGLWVGTGDYSSSWGMYYKGGLAHYDAQGQWQVFNSENSDLPGSRINVLSSDNQNLWIGTNGGLARYNNTQGEWQVFNTENSDLPDNQVNALLKDNQGALWMVGTEGGLAYYYTTPKPRFEIRNLGLPSNTVKTLSADNQSNLWVGTAKGLTYYTATGQWEVLNRGNSDLPDSTISALSVDTQGNLWIGTVGEGLIRYDEKQRTWTTFNSQNSGFQGGVTALLSDNEGGLWIGHGSTFSGMLTHYTTQGQWERIESYPGRVYPPATLLNDSAGELWMGIGEDPFYNSHGIYHYTQGQWQKLALEQSGDIDTFIFDGQGGLWIVIGGVLVHYTAQGQQTKFNSSNSGLSGSIRALLNGSQGSLWIGTDGGLIHFSTEGVWQKFTKENSGLPEYYSVYNLLSDNQGGIWLGTNRGLIHHTMQGKWEILNFTNSNLPSENILKLSSDNLGGLWIGTDKGLVHLRFSRKAEICQADATQCQNLQMNKRAAILIAGGGADSNNTLWDTTEAITNYLYKVLSQRGFDNDEIYYLSPKSWADFNGDGIDDRIVDAPNPGRPLTPEDIRLALDWAKGRGKLDQPLYLFFVDHGGAEKFQLSKLEYLEVTALKTWLDDYQTVTGNQVVMVIDACHSGQLLEQLKAPNRAIISSTSAGLAYFDRTDKRGFSRFFAAGLLKGMNFWEAFGYAGGEQTKLLGDISKLLTASTGKTQEVGQVPQFYDGSDVGKWLKQLYLNGSFAAGDVTLAVESLTTSTTSPASQVISLKAKAVLAAGKVDRVWGVIRPPRMNFILDSDGTPILAMPRLELSRSAEKDVWEATWTEAVYNGDYQVTFYAKDNQGNIASSDLPVEITVTDGVDPPQQATVQPELDKAQYHRGQTVTATLTEELSWGYDLYAALVLPDGKSFRAIKNTNELVAIDELVTVDNQLKALKNPNPTPWRGLRRQHSPLKVLELPLSDEWALGTYCFYGILSPEGGNVFESMAKGLGMLVGKCFEVVP
jgi:ligand-binding sensor domain-containing protein